MTMTMTRAAAATFLLASAALLVASDACDNVPSMGVDDACTKACSTVTPPLVGLCQTKLRNATKNATAEITVYAIAAAKQARSSYESSMAKVDQLLQNPTLPAGEKAAYVACKSRYMDALSLMIGVANQLSLCSFEYIRQEYFDATVTVGACGNELTAFQSSPLYDMNASDLKMTMLAYDIGGLIVGK